MFTERNVSSCFNKTLSFSDGKSVFRSEAKMIGDWELL